MIRLLVKEISDPYVQENFQRIVDFMENQKILKGNFKFHEIIIPVAVTNFKYKHGLGFTPKDIIQTSLIGATLTWNYANFDREFLDITTAGATTVRAFIGTYIGGRS